MSTSSTPRDTSGDAHALMIDRFAAMSIAERARVTQELNDMCTVLATAGIRAQHGDVSGNELRWHLAARRYGEPLANKVYGSR